MCVRFERKKSLLFTFFPCCCFGFHCIAWHLHLSCFEAEISVYCSLPHDMSESDAMMILEETEWHSTAEPAALVLVLDTKEKVVGLEVWDERTRGRELTSFRLILYSKENNGLEGREALFLFQLSLSSCEEIDVILHQKRRWVHTWEFKWKWSTSSSFSWFHEQETHGIKVWKLDSRVHSRLVHYFKQIVFPQQLQPISKWNS